MNEPDKDLLTSQLIQRAMAAREAKAVLEGKMKDLGKTFNELARTLQSPDDHIFSVSEITITIGCPAVSLSNPAAHVTPAHLNWDQLCQTLHRYNDAVRDLKAYTAKLGVIGVKLTD